MSAKRVLIIDDEEPIRFALSTILQDQGYEVEASETGGAGLNKLKEKPFGIVLLDYNLPDINGLEVAQKIRAIDN